MTEIEKALADFIAASINKDPKARAALIAAVTAAIERAENEGEKRGVALAALVAQHWANHYPVEVWPEDGGSLDAKAAKHGRHSAAMIAENIRALHPPPPAPSELVGHLDNGSEVRTSYGGDSIDPSENDGPIITYDPPAPSEECADDFDPDYGKCPACEGRGLVPSDRPYEGQQSICARCGGTGRATKGEFDDCACPSHVHQIECQCGCGGKPINRKEIK